MSTGRVAMVFVKSSELPRPFGFSGLHAVAIAATRDAQLSLGIVNQVVWPKAGDVDDCWACATIQAGIAVAPHLPQPNITRFRAAAGNPDEPNKPDGGTIRQCATAIRTLWPKLGALIDTSAGEHTWAWLRDMVEGDAPPKIANPLAPAQSRWDDISWAALERAVKAFPNPGVHAVVMPTVEEAFTTHPLYLAPGTPDPVELDEAEARGFEAAKKLAGTVATTAIAGITREV